MSFFDRYSVFYPWPKILRQSGLKFTYKPREVWWKNWIRKLDLKPGKKILEVGCGRGVFLDRLAGEYGGDFFGIDLAREAIKEAKRESLYKLDLRVSDACSLPFPDSYFDVVFSLDVLEHIRNQKKAVSEMIRVLKKPGGKLLIYTINSRQFLTWNWCLDKLGIDVFRRSNHNPRFFVNPEWLKKEIEKGGVEVLEISYFDSFFTLFFDEAIMIFLSLWQRFFGFRKKDIFAKIILGILTGISKISTPLMKILDFPWIIFRYSNGFLIFGEKK